MKKIIFFTFVVYIITLSCAKKVNNPNKQPGNDTLAGDLVIDESKFFLSGESKLSEYIEETESVFSSFRKIEIEKTSKNVFLLSNYGEIYKMDINGNPLFKIQAHGQGPGEMAFPIDIKVRNKKLYVQDEENNKILIFDLNGNWIKDVVIHDLVVQSFEVDRESHLIIPKVERKKNSDTPLFVFYNDEGQVVHKISKNSDLEEDFSTIPIRPILSLSPNFNLLLTFKIQGRFYLFAPDGALLQIFSIQGGPEWSQSVERQKIIDKETNGRSWPWRVENVGFDSHGNIYATWGGSFKDKKSIVMIYNQHGNFIGRLFGNDWFPFPPTCFAIESDSIFWIHSFEKFLLARVKIQSNNLER